MAESDKDTSLQQNSNSEAETHRITALSMLGVIPNVVILSIVYTESQIFI